MLIERARDETQRLLLERSELREWADSGILVERVVQPASSVRQSSGH